MECKTLDRFGETEIDQHGRMDAVSQFPQLVNRELQLAFGLAEDHRAALWISGTGAKR